MDTDRLHPFTGSDPDGENHWWLEDVITNKRFDLTSAQYSKKELEFFYGTGRPKKIVFVSRQTAIKVYRLDGIGSAQHKEIHYF